MISGPPGAGDREDPALRADGGRPRYQLLATRLREEIESGRYTLGSLLPTEFEISAQFNVSRATVREAMRQLQADGLVSRRAGVGTRVTSPRPTSHYTQSGSSIEDFVSDGDKIRLVPEEMRDIVAGDELAAFLRCSPRQGFLYVRGVVVSAEAGDGSLPFYSVEVWVAAAFAGIRDRISTHRGLVAKLVEQQYGERVSEIHQSIGAVLVEQRLAKRLRVASGSPALRFQRWYYGSEAWPFQVTVSVRPAERFTYDTRLVRPKIA
jgi:GntR family transcriptional regulator